MPEPVLLENDRFLSLSPAAGSTALSYDFLVDDADELELKRLRGGVAAVLAYPADYTVSGLGQVAGGSITLAQPSLDGDVYEARGRTRLKRLAAYISGNAIKAQALNADVNRLWIALQELRRDGVPEQFVDFADKASLPEAIAANIPVMQMFVRIGNSLYWRAASEPAHAGKFQNADGGWWELVGGAETTAASSYLVTVTDHNKITRFLSAGPVNVQFSNDLPPGFRWRGKQVGEGDLSFSVESGASLSPPGELGWPGQGYSVEAFVDANADGASAAVNLTIVSAEAIGVVQGLVDEAAAFALAALAASQAAAIPVNWKASVRVATTANGDFATAFANGQTVNGVVLATGDPILIRAQTAGAENGIFNVPASGPPTRRTDADTEAELLRAGVSVDAGTVDAGTEWICATPAPITVGTTPLLFVKLGTGRAETVLAESWALLNTIPGAWAGQKAEIRDNVGATHTGLTYNSGSSTVAGVADAGEYRWNTSPAGWRWMGPLLLDETPRIRPTFVVGDANGNLADPPITRLGYRESFTLADCDAIGVWGDSLVDASYVLKDKAWVSVVSQLSAYRFVNMGRSGFDAAEIYGMHHDGRIPIVPNVSWDYNHIRGAPWGARRLRYGILLTWTNDLASHGRAGYLQQVRKFIDLLRANDIQPVLLAEHRPGSPLDTSNDQAVILANIAREHGCHLILEPYQAGKEFQLLNGPFHDGLHPGTRSGLIYANAVLRWLERIPKPNRGMKAYGLRAGMVVGGLNDLVFRNEHGLSQRFKEISITHAAITVQPEHFEERNKYLFNGTAGPDGAPNVGQIADEYNKIRGGGIVDLAEYGLLRIALKSGSRSLRGIAVEMYTDATAVYVLDRFGRNTAGTDDPTGTWVAIPYSGGAVRLDQSTLARCMYANELYLLLYKSGGVKFGRPEIHHSGFDAVPEPRLIRTYDVSSAELLATQSLASLTGWTTAGSPAVVSPFDLAFGAPRAPGSSSAIAAVTEIDAAAKVGQSITVQPSKELTTTFRVRVMCRNWEKLFADNSLSGYGFPAGEVIDRSGGALYPDDSPITSDTFDFRRLRLEVLFSAAPSTAFTTYEAQDKIVGLWWTELDFIVSTLSSVLPASLNFRLSGPDGVVQVAKVSLREVIEHVRS
ncbi:MAG: SGNH/GDSL hydrolase family protein [Parvibaculaceae bacterium]